MNHSPASLGAHVLVTQQRAAARLYAQVADGLHAQAVGFAQGPLHFRIVDDEALAIAEIRMNPSVMPDPGVGALARKPGQIHVVRVFLETRPAPSLLHRPLGVPDVMHHAVLKPD